MNVITNYTQLREEAINQLKADNQNDFVLVEFTNEFDINNIKIKDLRELNLIDFDGDYVELKVEIEIPKQTVQEILKSHSDKEKYGLIQRDLIDIKIADLNIEEYFNYPHQALFDSIYAFFKSNLTLKQQDVIDTLANEIQEEVNMIPCLKNLDLEFNIFNVRFDEEENPIFDIKIDNTVIHDVTGEYDTRYYHLYDWQESEQIGSQIAKILVDIAKNKANVNLEFLEDIRGDFDFTRRGESWSESYNNYYECLSTSNGEPFKYYTNFNKYDDNVVYFNGRMYYFDVEANEDVQKFLQECQDGLYSEVNQKSYNFDKEKILQLIVDEVADEFGIGTINDFWDMYNQDLKLEYPSTEFDYMLENLPKKDYVVITRKGKDFYVMPEITGDEESLSFQRIMSQEEKTQITQELKNIYEDIIFNGLEHIKDKINIFLETEKLDEIITEKKQQIYNDIDDDIDEDILNSLTEVIKAQNDKNIHI